ncbi:MAG: C10 family peptidase, partial [Parabacteroides sp.]|nr:C10 family peptidase [Parabacteroides sp.]
VHRQAVMACMRVAEEDFSAKSYTITPMLEEGDTCYYVVQFEPEGWALISADDRVQPLIGYSDKGLFQKEEAPEAALFWLEKRAKEIQVIKSLKGLKRDKDWNYESLRSESISEAIAPLIKVNWRQDMGFNKYCPLNDKGRKTLVGCVAVAMGQAMSVYQYPSRPKLKVSYNKEDEVGWVEVDFDKEQPYDWEKILSGADDNDEVARFLYHCGVAVRTRYGENESGAFVSEVREALIHHFSYRSDSLKYYVKQYNKEENGHNYQCTYSEEEWSRMILHELKQGRPLISALSLGYAIHALNVDGYDGINTFHLNWGWGGASNGYYTVDELRGKDYYYPLLQSELYRDKYAKIVIGIIPVEQSSTDIESVAQSLETPLQVVGSLLRLKSPEKGICRVYDLSGALLQTAPVVAGDNEILLKTKGLCILSVDCNGKVASHKINVKE